MEKYTYRLLRGSHGHYVDGANVITKPGPDSYLELTAEAAAGMKDIKGSRVERVDLGALQELAAANAEAAEKTKAEVEPGAEDKALHLEGMNVAKAVQFIDAIENETLLDEVEAQEKAQEKPRKGVLEAIASVRAEFNGGDED